MASIAFYHCFPRFNGERSAEVTSKLGLKTLSLILEHGLLLTPEEQIAGGVELRSSRICFTALQSQDLWRHSIRFGQFAIEYSIEDFLSLGALPAIYLPVRAAGANALSDSGMRFLLGLEYIRRVLNGLKDSTNQAVTEPVHAAIGGQQPDLAKLAWIPVIGQNLFYPVDSTKYASVGPLGYYAQREWKIINNFVTVDANGKAVWDFINPTPEQKDKLIEANEWFAGQFGRSRIIDHCQFFTSMGDVSVIDKIQRIIVPAEHAKEAADIVNGRRPVVTIEEVAAIAHAGGSGI